MKKILALSFLASVLCVNANDFNGDGQDPQAQAPRKPFFNAVLDGDHVVLDWMTSTENGQAYFAVERSREGESWTEISRILVGSESKQRIGYADVDNSPLKGISYYRLRQVDALGNITYSGTVILKINNLLAETVETEFIPADFSGFGDEDVLVVTRNLSGELNYSHVHVVRDKDQLIAIDLDDRLGAGNYLVVAASQDMLVSKRIIVR